MEPDQQTSKLQIYWVYEKDDIKYKYGRKWKIENLAEKHNFHKCWKACFVFVVRDLSVERPVFVIRDLSTLKKSFIHIQLQHKIIESPTYNSQNIIQPASLNTNSRPCHASPSASRYIGCVTDNPIPRKPHPHLCQIGIEITPHNCPWIITQSFQYTTTCH